MNDNPIVASRSTINPYLYASGELLRRIKWDLHPLSWVSRTRIRSWKDRFTGQKAIIVCNGPSLLKSDLALLDGIFTFGLNKINLLFEKSTFRPSCIVAVNPLVIEQNKAFYNETDIPLFLDSRAIKIIRSRSNVVFMHSSRQQKMARDCSISINQGCTVTFVAMQLAFHMGFHSVALIGCDHNFSAKGSPNQTVASGENDDSHFDPSYFSGGMKWQLPDLVQSELSYALAKEVYEAFDRKIFNATEGGQLELLPRIRLADFVHSTR
jgi:hypothetical protein